MREGLANDDPHVVARDDRDRGLVPVAASHQLDQPASDARLDLSDLFIAHIRNELVPYRGEDDLVPRRERRELVGAREVDEAGVPGLAHLLDEERRGRLVRFPVAGTVCRCDVRCFLPAAGGIRTHTTADSFATSIPAATS